MNLKKILKGVGAVTMVGALLLGVTACNSNDTDDITIPTPIVDDVVSDTEDTPTAINEAENDTVVEETIEYIPTWYALNTLDGVKLGGSFEKTLDDNDLDNMLFDGKVSFDGETYKAKSVLELSEDLIVANSGDFDNDFESEPALIFDHSGAITYKYIIDDKDFDWGEISTKETLEVNFLGKEIEILGAGNSDITILAGEKVTLNSGEEFVYGDHSVKFLKASTTTALLEVDGEAYSKKVGDTLFKDGIQVYVDSVFDEQDPTYENAILFVGEKVKETVDDGDTYIEGWEWTIDTTEGYFGISYDVRADEADEEVLLIGDELIFADYFKFKFALDNEPDTFNYEFEIDSEEINETVTDVVVISGDIETSEDDYDEVVWTNTGQFFAKEDGKYVEVTDVELGESELELSSALEFGDLQLIPDFVQGNLDVLYAGNSLKDTEEDVLTAKGIVVESPEDSFEDGEVSITVPEEEPEFALIVSGLY